MSYSNTFQDYLRDIPMEIGHRFYPPPLINLPPLTIPELPREFAYPFEAEQRARQQFDDANRKPEPKPEQSHNGTPNGLTSSESLSSSNASLTTNEVLTPCAAPPTVAAPIPSTCVRPKPVSFEEFEGKGTVFDELEWKTIDDKLALSQILGKVSLDAPPPPSTPNLEVTTPNPNEHKAPVPVNGSRTVGGPVLPNYPVLDFDPRSKSEEPTVFLSSTGEMSTAVFTKPSAPVKEMPSQPAQGSSLRVRLLTKGYRQNLVDVALARVPRERLQYVEYYMKGMSILEKKGVDADKTVKFLLDSNISDKQAVVQRAQTAEQLIGMGFTAEQVFLGLLTTQGDRVKALDMLLGTR